MHRSKSLFAVTWGILILFLLTVHLQACTFEGYDEKEEFQKAFPLKEDGIFALTNVNGNVTVETWAKDEVSVWAEKAVRGRRDNLDKIQIEIESGSRYVRVNTVYPKIPNFRGRVRYEIKVPEGVKLEKIRTVNGSVNITGLVYDVLAASTNGNVVIREASGKLDLSTTNGSVKASDVEGEIQARSTNGSIRLEIYSVTDEIKARTTNGGISLSIESSNVNADVEARTTNGRIHVDFPVTIEGGWSSKRSLEGRIGDGGPLISLKTTNGSVKILD